jgi:predicted nucleic acid-binding protein
MNTVGVLLDTGPLVALLSRTDANHERARALFRSYAPPFRTCEAVLVEASHLLSRDRPVGPADIVRLGAAGLFEVALRIDEHWAAIERTLRKYVDIPAALADACLIRCAEVHNEPRILTFDEDFRVYRWSGRKPFEILP